MITISQYADKNVGVFGLGKAGLAAVRALSASGAKVYAADDNAKNAHKLSDETDLTASNITDWPWDTLEAVVLSPGVPLTHPQPHAVVVLAQKHHCPIIGDVELLTQACPDAKYIGITGTNGKSTTTSLLGHILRYANMQVEVGGNLGDAAVSLKPLGEGGVYVLEMSSYQLDLLDKTHFDIACFLNITPDHIDRHGDMDGYVAAKMHIFDRQTAADTAIVAIDDDYTKKIAAQLDAAAVEVMRVSAYGADSAQYGVVDGVFFDRSDATVALDIRAVHSLLGQHNWQNAVVAYAAARACGIAPATIYGAMLEYPGLRHRMQQVAHIRNVRFVNDSKATNADASSCALKAFDTIYWIAGGKAKEGGIDDLQPYFSKIEHVFLIGDAQDAFAETLDGKVSFTKCGTLEHAVTHAAQMAFEHDGDAPVVLLSPACASFDQWVSFEARGDAFCEQVEAMCDADAKGAANAS